MRLVLASRSPRRRELLTRLLPNAELLAIPPRNSEEANFDGLEGVEEIQARLLQIAETKLRDVQEQLRDSRQAADAIIAGDTIIVVRQPDGRAMVLGQPPEGPEWRDVVRSWFRNYYAGREHAVWTGVCLDGTGGKLLRRVVRTTVTMTADVDRWLEWYLDTEESLGKAGGYALQGLGSVFIEEVRGSLTNVIGLPLREVSEMLRELHSDVGGE